MLPFRDQYIPTNTSNEESNKSLKDRKKSADTKGQIWSSKYLFHVPSYREGTLRYAESLDKACKPRNTGKKPQSSR